MNRTRSFPVQIWIAALLPVLLFPLLTSGQTSDVEFGKNRVQHHDDFNYYWMYESQNFITYWYGKGRRVAESVIKLAEYDHAEIQGILEHRINDKIQILVYTDVTNLKQSNIGTEDVFINEAGKTKIAGNKMFVYFNGSHENLRKQIRQGIARVYLDQMLFGSNLQEFVQNAILINLPDWYIKGLVSFAGESWSEEVDDRMRQIFMYNDFERFLEFANKYPDLAGHSLWYYISSRYGNTALSNLLYLTRINRRLENGFLHVLGQPYELVVNESFQYYKQLYSQQAQGFESLKPTDIKVYKKKKKIPLITQVAWSPDGSQLVYVLNEIGKCQVYLHDIKSGDRSLLLKRGFRNPFQETDYDYPMVAWHPNGDMLALIYEKNDVIYLKEIDLRSGEERLQEVAPEYYRIYDFAYLGANRFVFAASTDGYSDLYIYNPEYRTSERLTEDFYDDLDVKPFTYKGEKGFVFASNRDSEILETLRVDSILPLGRFDLFFYPIGSDGKSVRRLTNSPEIHERSPVALGEDRLMYLSNQSGIWNRWQMNFDGTSPGVAFPKTNKITNVLAFDVVGDKVADVTEFRGFPYLHLDPFDVEERVDVRWTSFANARNPVSTLIAIDEGEKELPDIDVSEEEQYLFQSRFPDELENVFPEKPGKKDIGEGDYQLNFPNLSDRYKQGDKKVVPFRSNRAIAYRLHFRFEEVTTTLDNSPLFGGLDSYAGFKRGFEYPPVGILIKTEVKDLFEDYRFEFGTRISTNFNGAEYFLIFDDLKSQWDKRFAFYRKGLKERNNEQFDRFDETRTTTHLFQAEFKYPLNIFSSFRLTGTLRLDRFIFLASEQGALAEPDLHHQRVGLKAEYVFDNTFDISTNIKNGTRAKVYVEAVNRFELDFSPMTFSPSAGFMTVIGIDARHYERLDRYSIFAARLAGATTLGSERILYYMGGVDNWLSPSYNQSIPFPQEDHFAYQTSAVNMRGFRQNIRNGSSYVLLNTELRLPVFNYLSKKPLRSSFLRNFQVIGFLDAGTAWHGSSPYSDDNPLNSVTLFNPVAKLNVEYFRDPVVIGYGAGVRVQLFGYFVRMDYGWGIETRERQDPRLYIALGTDF